MSVAPSDFTTIVKPTSTLSSLGDPAVESAPSQTLTQGPHLLSTPDIHKSVADTSDSQGTYKGTSLKTDASDDEDDAADGENVSGSASAAARRKCRQQCRLRREILRLEKGERRPSQVASVLQTAKCSPPPEAEIATLLETEAGREEVLSELQECWWLNYNSEPPTNFEPPTSTASRLSVSSGPGRAAAMLLAAGMAAAALNG